MCTLVYLPVRAHYGVLVCSLFVVSSCPLPVISSSQLRHTQTHVRPPSPLQTPGRIQGAYISTNRELKRLDALSFSPIFHHYSESLAGLTTLRAFRQQGAFAARNQVGLGRRAG
jgi:hypothetical protein